MERESVETEQAEHSRIGLDLCDSVSVTDVTHEGRDEAHSLIRDDLEDQVIQQRQLLRYLQRREVLEGLHLSSVFRLRMHRLRPPPTSFQPSHMRMNCDHVFDYSKQQI